MIHDRLGETQSRQKAYANRRFCFFKIQVSDQVFLYVLPIKGIMRNGRKGKLIHMYIGPFKILHTVGELDYELALPQDFVSVYLFFYVSIL